jgi:hypothetical protein
MCRAKEVHIMADSHSSGAVAEFVEHLRGDPKLLEATWNRPQDRPAAVEAALDYVVAVAAERGFSFSREELVEAVRDALPDDGIEDEGAVRVSVSVGSLGFGRVMVGLSNPSEVMCQYHAPMALLAEESTGIR